MLKSFFQPNRQILRSSRVTSHKGFSIVELMVSITIGLFLLAGAATLFSSSKRTYVVNDDLGRIQENARFAIAYLTHDLRMAGYFGCSNDMASVNNIVSVAATGNLFDVSRPVEGYDPAAAVADRLWQPSGNNDVANIVANNDGITVRFVEPTGISVTALMAGPSANLAIQQPNDFQQGDIVAISDCASTDVIQISGPAGGTNISSIVHAVGSGITPDNTQAALSKQYDTDANVMRLGAYRYYVGSDEAVDAAGDADNVADPVLVRESLSLTGTTVAGTAIQLVDGLEFMQITYGVDTNGDRVPDTYINSAATAGAIDLTTTNGWDAVISVRIGLLFRSSEEVAPDQDTADFTVNGIVICDADDDDNVHDVDGTACDATIDHPTDRRRRKAFTTTVLLRNLR